MYERSRWWWSESHAMQLVQHADIGQIIRGQLSAWFRRSDNDDCNEFAPARRSSTLVAAVVSHASLYVYTGWMHDRQVMSRHHEMPLSRMFFAHCHRRRQSTTTGEERERALCYCCGFWCWTMGYANVWGEPQVAAAGVGDHMIAYCQFEMIAFSLSPLMSHFATHRRDVMMRCVAAVWWCTWSDDVVNGHHHHRPLAMRSCKFSTAKKLPAWSLRSGREESHEEAM